MKLHQNKYFHSILFKYQLTALWCLFDFFFLDRPVIVWMGRPCLLFADFLKTTKKINAKKNNWRENLKKIIPSVTSEEAMAIPV